MRIEYNIEQFRKSLRQAFNEADNGREIIITRYGQEFRLSALANSEGIAGPHDTVEDDGTPVTYVEDKTIEMETGEILEPTSIGEKDFIGPSSEELFKKELKLCAHNMLPQYCPYKCKKAVK